MCALQDDNDDTHHLCWITAPILEGLGVQLFLQFLQPSSETVIIHLELAHSGAHSLAPDCSRDESEKGLSNPPGSHLFHLLDGACSAAPLPSQLALQVLNLLVVHRAEPGLVLRHLLLVRIAKLLRGNVIVKTGFLSPDAKMLGRWSKMNIT